MAEINRNKLTKAQLEKALKCKTAEELCWTNCIPDSWK